MKSRKHIERLLDQATVGDYECQECGELVENIAVLPEVHLRCPECCWEPITVLSVNGVPVSARAVVGVG